MRTVFKSMTAAGLLIAAAGAGMVTRDSAAFASAQPGVGGVVVSANPGRDNLLRLLNRTVTVNMETPSQVRDVLASLAAETGVDFEVLYRGDREPDGIDPEIEVQLSVKDLPALDYLERVLEAAAEDPADEQSRITWQLRPTGTVQVGTKLSLGRFREVRFYTIEDLIIDIPEFSDVPELDLDQVLQNTGGGGGGGGAQGSPFDDNDDDNEEDERDAQERAQELIDLIQAYVESDQWQANGGNLRPPRLYQLTTLVIDAPDFVHRGIGGYTFLPVSGSNRVGAAKPRFVSLTPSLQFAQPAGFGVAPVTGVVGGN